MATDRTASESPGDDQPGRRRAAITATGQWLPEDRLTNADIERMVDTTDKWIFERCGIRERRILRDPDKGTAYMAAGAARDLLRRRQIDPGSIGLVILTTATPEYQYPATATIVADMIGAKQAWGFDLMAACSSFVYALDVARQFIENGSQQRVLVIGSDKMSSIVDYTDRTTCILFGDGAGAVLLEPAEDGTGLLDTRLYAEGASYELIYQPAGGSRRPATMETVRDRLHYVKMKGRPVYKLAVERMTELGVELMERNHLTGDDVAWLVAHQANRRIIEATATRLGLDPNKLVLNIERLGNTTTATIPLCLSEWEPRLKRGDNLLLVAFGAGLTWGGVYLKWHYDTPAAG